MGNVDLRKQNRDTPGGWKGSRGALWSNCLLEKALWQGQVCLCVLVWTGKEKQHEEQMVSVLNLNNRRKKNLRGVCKAEMACISFFKNINDPILFFFFFVFYYILWISLCVCVCSLQCFFFSSWLWYWTVEAVFFQLSEISHAFKKLAVNGSARSRRYVLINQGMAQLEILPFFFFL